jgi:hypothetical protein
MRSAKGETLISVLVATLLMTFVLSAILALAVVNTREQSAYFNRSDTITAAKTVLDRIGKTVRSARSVGDVYGVVPVPTAPVTSLASIAGGAVVNINLVDGSQIPLAQLESGTAMMTSSSFPSLGDPYYGTGGSCTLNAPAEWSSPPWTLSSTTLIVQVPVFDANGFPFAFVNPNPGAQNPGNLEAMDTFVYNVTADSTRTGMYKMQVACFPASPRPAGVPAPGSQTPSTILTGIVGPRDADGNLCIFQYVDSATNSAASSVVGGNLILANNGIANLLNVQGVVTTLEIKKQDEGRKAAVVALRTETYMRNNKMTTLIGVPNNQ